MQKLSHHEEYLRKKKKRRLVNLALFVFTLVLIVGMISYISRREKFRIANVNLFGGILVTEDEVQKKAFEYLDGSYFWLFPKNNAFIYPKTKLEEYLKDSFKRIDTIDITLKGFQRLSVAITERKHFAVWCKGVPEQVSEEECYFMDKNSTVFALAPNFSGDAYFKYYGLISDSVSLGREFISSTTVFSQVSDFVDTVKKLGLRPKYVFAQGDGEYVMKLNGGGEILFDDKASFLQTSLNLSALLATDALSKLDKTSLPVEYLDLRFGNKLFYRLKSTSTSSQ